MGHYILYNKNQIRDKFFLILIFLIKKEKRVMRLITMLLIWVFKLMLSPIYIIVWLTLLPFRIFFIPFKTKNKEHIGLLNSIGLCLMFNDLFK